MTNREPENLIEALRRSAGGERSITFINGKTEERELSYGELWNRASRLLGYLREKRIESADELVLFVETNEEFVDGFWASVLGGIVAVPLAIGAADIHIQKLFNVFRKLERPKLYCTEKNRRRIEKFAIRAGLAREFGRMRARTVLVIEDLHDRSPANAIEATPEQTAFIQFSSGSTGDPKGVVLTHHNVMTNVRGILKAMNIRGEDSSLSWMPMTHDMGIIGFHIAPMVTNAALYLMPTELFVRRPMLWLSKLSEKRATITASPNFGYQHLLRRFSAEPGALDLSCVRLIFNGAEPISASLCRAFFETLAPFGYRSQAMFPVYGLAEASLAVTFSEPESPLTTVKVRRASLSLDRKVEVVCASDASGIELVSVGSAIEGSEIRIVDSHEQSASEGQVGHIRIRGDNVTRGYYRDEELNARTFKSDGWFDTGDLGFFYEGHLFIAGRSKDLIIINGQNFHAHDLEAICESDCRLEAGRVAALGLCRESEIGEALAVFIVFRGTLENFVPMVRKIRRLLSEQAGVHADFVVPVRAIPKTTSGKIQRYLIGEQFQSGEFDAKIEELERLLSNASTQVLPDKGGIPEILLHIARSVIDEHEIAVDDNLFELGISSLNLAQIFERIEERFPGQVEIGDLFECPSVRALSAFLERKQEHKIG